MNTESARVSEIQAECSAPESLLCDIFGELEVAGIRYCVMRNYENLPQSVGTSDLDILLIPGDLEAAERAIAKALASNGGCIVASVRARSCYLKTMGCVEGRWWGLAIDLVADVDYQGMVYTKAETIIRYAEEHRGVMVASSCDAASMALVKELMNNLTTTPEYVADVRDVLRNRPDGADRGLEGFGAKVKTAFLKAVETDVENPDELRQLGLAMRADLRRRNLADVVRIAISEILHRMVRVWQRPGPVVVVTGTDGSGKSTLLNAILPVLSRAFHKRVHVEHLRPHWMPSLGKALGRRVKESNSTVTNPHAAPPDGFAKSLIRLGYYYLDYTIGYYWKIFPLLAGRIHLVCFDRYYYDIIVDPQRMRIDLPSWVLKLAFSLAPKPDLLICLGGDPAEIFRRKPETSEAEVGRQVEALKRICQRTSHESVWIDTTHSLQDSRNEALTAILEVIGRRAAH